MMRISWVLQSDYRFDSTVDMDRIKSVGPLWGSWQTWRDCQTDNVVSHEMAKCRELLDRAFQAVCNFYIPKKHYQSLNRPMGVKLYEGDFIQEVTNIEDIVSMHLASQQSDIVLMLGFDLETSTSVRDQYEAHKFKNYHGLIRSIIHSTPTVQWVCVDHRGIFDKAYKDLGNLSQDSMKKVFEML